MQDTTNPEIPCDCGCGRMVDQTQQLNLCVQVSTWRSPTLLGRVNMLRFWDFAGADCLTRFWSGVDRAEELFPIADWPEDQDPQSIEGRRLQGCLLRNVDVGVEFVLACYVLSGCAEDAEFVNQEQIQFEAPEAINEWWLSAPAPTGWWQNPIRDILRIQAA